jgi:uncharacterized Zn-finger protein
MTDSMEKEAEKEHRVTKADLPLCCPMPGMEEWRMHPRVFLPLEQQKKATCPYCGKRYILVSVGS